MKKLLTVVLLIVSSHMVLAGDIARKGTTGAEQLLVPVGARGIATGGAMLANITGLESIYYNPAGLDVSGASEAMFSYMNYLADVNVTYFAAAAALGDLGTIGLSFKSFDFGDIDETTAEMPDGTGKTYSPGYFVAGLTYSKIITDRISIGTNLKLISESIMNTTATGFAIDFGVQYRFNNNLSMGASVKNIGSNMRYGGDDLQGHTDVPGSFPGSGTGTYEIVTEEFQIPSYFELSAAYKYGINEQNNLLLGSTYTVNNAMEDMLNLGAEYGFMNTFFVRGGYNLQMENTDQSIFGFTAGAGLNYTISDGVGFNFDYAYRDVKEFPEPNHIFTVKLAFK